MPKILYVTTNKPKFNKAKNVIEQANIDLKRVDFDFQEIQSSDGKEIALNKAKQAYEQFKKPLIASDDIWEIPALNGFPGGYMKDVDSWFDSEDWLRLMNGVSDRRIYLISNIVYKDKDKELFFVLKSERYFISKERTEFSKDSLLDVIALKGSKDVISKEKKEGRFSEKISDEFWKKISKDILNLK